MTHPKKADSRSPTADRLTRYTPARVSLGRTGHSLPTARLLEFNLDHARARDAVYSEFDWQQNERGIAALGCTSMRLESQASDRRTYLLRPDLGRKLSPESLETLRQVPPAQYDLCIVLADGLSAVAVNTHALEITKRLIEKTKQLDWEIAPVALVAQGRVAIADEIGEALQAEMTLILIGERPGLSSPHSLGAYLTHRPRVGLTDERRNCVSNIRPDGLTYDRATEKILYLLQEMKAHQISGVGLKDTLYFGLGPNLGQPE